MAGPPRARTLCKMAPVHARKRRGVNAARAAATWAGATPEAGESVPPRWEAGGGLAGRARERSWGMGCGAPSCAAKKRPSERRGICHNQGREGEDWWEAGGYHARARGQEEGAMRVAQGLLGCLPTPGGRRRHEDLVVPTAAGPSGPAAVPPRGVEPRTLPTIRPTGRPGQRVNLRSTPEAKPAPQPLDGSQVVKADRARNLRVTSQGEGGSNPYPQPGHAVLSKDARCLLNSELSCVLTTKWG